MKKVLVGVVIVLAAIAVFFLAQKWAGDDLDGLAGEAWAVLGMEDRGQKIPVERLKVKGIRFAKDTVTWLLLEGDDKLAGLEGKLQIDPSKNPKEIDVEMPGAGIMRGIYEIKGDKLRICLDEKRRPKDFAGGSNMVWMLTR
jgi:uncharacterized protein (TIGR03067 family)